MVGTTKRKNMEHLFHGPIELVANKRVSKQRRLNEIEIERQNVSERGYNLRFAATQPTGQARSYRNC